MKMSPTPEVEACNWPVLYTDCSGQQVELWKRWGDDATEAQATFEGMATDLLWNLTDRVYGVCDTIVRPCRDDCAGSDGSSTFWGRGPGFDPSFPRAGRGGMSTGGWTPVLVGGKWMNLGCGCVSGCRCAIDGAHAISLPGPVQSIRQIRLDGVVVPADAYRVDHHRLLVRTDGGTWPACQDPLADPTANGTFEVAYERGVPVPVGGMVAAGRLAYELGLAACDDSKCALPERLQSVTRQGVTVGVALTGQSWRDTGIWSIDSWVSSIVRRPQGYAAVRSVDVPARRR